MTEKINWKAPGHENCSWGYKTVRCDYCGAEYTCRPSSDYYCVNPDLVGGDVKHSCEPCLMKIMRTDKMVVVTHEGEEVTHYATVQLPEKEDVDEREADQS